MKEPQTSLDRNPTGTEMHSGWNRSIHYSVFCTRLSQLCASEDHRAALREWDLLPAAVPWASRRGARRGPGDGPITSKRQTRAPALGQSQSRKGG